jgi:hypothetical protein
MLLPGHLHIYKEVMRGLDVYYNDIGSEHVNKLMLKSGLIYPDMPCSKYGLKDNHVIIHRMQICSMFKLTRVISKSNEMDEIFQSHNGMYAFLHAMTYDPKKDVKTVRIRIVRMMMVYAILALYDMYAYDIKPKKSPNIFWIGMIMHTIQDSYSNAHTIRGEERHVVKAFPENPENVNPRDTWKQSFRSMLYRLASTHKKTDQLFKSEEELGSYLKGKYAKRKDASIFMRHFERRGQKKLFKTYKLYIFDVQNQILLDAFFKKNNEQIQMCQCLHLSHLSHLSKGDTLYDIRNFQYYKKQPLGYHTLHDMVSKVQKYPDMYARMVNECRDLLITYKSCLTSLKTNQNDASKVSSTVRQYLDDMYELISCRVFRVSPQYYQDKTGQRYA